MGSWMWNMGIGWLLLCRPYSLHKPHMGSCGFRPYSLHRPISFGTVSSSYEGPDMKCELLVWAWGVTLRVYGCQNTPFKEYLETLPIYNNGFWNYAQFLPKVSKCVNACECPLQPIGVRRPIFETPSPLWNSQNVQLRLISGGSLLIKLVSGAT